MVRGKESSAVAAKPAKSAVLDGLYDRDFALWCDETARLILTGDLTEIDIEHLAEEIQDMGASQRHEVSSRLRVLLIHLLKWDQQPEMRGPSWLSTIDTQRAELDDVFDRSPSLRRTLAESVAKIYPAAVRGASLQTGLPRNAFPAKCPYTLEQILDPDFPPATRR